MRHALLLAVMLLIASCDYQQTPEGGEIEETLEELFHCGIKLPDGMDKMKKGTDFVWISDDDAYIMRNICIYSYAGDALCPDSVATIRDSVMRKNLPGEEEGMYMRTEPKMPVSNGMFKKDGRQVMRTIGQWEMEGDAMGGPFVCHSRIDSARHRVLVAEAFVYAPGKNKRQVMKTLERALLTLEIKR